MAEIVLEQVTKVYPNGAEAVSALDLTVGDGEFMVLVGPSGCGKTTALRMVAGLEGVTSGTIQIGDEVVNDISSRNRDIAMVFQNYALYPHMTVAENIGFALRLRKRPKEEVAKKVEAAAAMLGLSEWLDRKPGQLSGGQRQRVAMGRAMVREPEAFLMDEPLSNLDAKLRVQMRVEIARLQRRLGVATLYVTHDQVEAMTMGDRVAVLRDGLLQQCATPQKLYDEPANTFVASFIGSPAMNLYEASLGEGARSLHLGSQRLELPESLLARRPGLQRYTSRAVAVGMRPEDFSLAPAGAPNVLDSRVEVVEALGSEQLVHFSLDATRIDVVADNELAISGEGVARLDPRASVKPGERTSFEIDPARMHFLDRDSGEAIWE
jgi:multiple sugar transport system ATP-binding protein